ncbi:MAG: hypothetical protein LN575_02440 [Rickettsia endosymbiont of Gnoriste bilineata]|nr:hypothetical protein [Rickettsia endosymbiont of Gnoriste bilineata]
MVMLKILSTEPSSDEAISNYFLGLLRRLMPFRNDIYAPQSSLRDHVMVEAIHF